MHIVTPLRTQNTIIVRHMHGKKIRDIYCRNHCFIIFIIWNSQFMAISLVNMVAALPRDKNKKVLLIRSIALVYVFFKKCYFKLFTICKVQSLVYQQFINIIKMIQINVRFCKKTSKMIWNKKHILFTRSKIIELPRMQSAIPPLYHRQWWRQKQQKKIEIPTSSSLVFISSSLETSWKMLKDK